MKRNRIDGRSSSPDYVKGVREAWKHMYLKLLERLDYGDISVSGILMMS